MDPKDIKEIKAIIDLMKKHDLSVFEIEKEGFRLKLEKGSSVQAAAAIPPAVAAQAEPASTAPETAPPGPKAIESIQLKDIVSPMVGTFYRSASPDGAPFGWIICFSQIADSWLLPCRSNGASTKWRSQSGQPQAIARYSFFTRCCCISNPNRRAATGVFATRTKPLVSRSRRFTIETCPPLAISNASSSRNSFQRLRTPFGFVGWVRRNGGLSTTM